MSLLLQIDNAEHNGRSKSYNICDECETIALVNRTWNPSTELMTGEWIEESDWVSLHHVGHNMRYEGDDEDN